MTIRTAFMVLYTACNRFTVSCPKVQLSQGSFVWRFMMKTGT